MDITDWPSPQEPSGSTPTKANINPASQPSEMAQGHVEVDQLPQAWEYDFDLDFEHLPSQIPTSKLALMRQRRRRQQQYRRRGPSRPEPRLHRQGRPDRSHNATSMLNHSSHSFSSRPTDSNMEVIRQPAHVHGHQQSSPREWVGPEPASRSSPVLLPEATIEPDLVMSNDTSCGGSTQERDKEMDMTPQDGPPPAFHGDLVPENNTAQSSSMGTHSRPPLRYSTLRSESIRAALALEALSLNSESSDYPHTAPTTPSASPDSGDDQDLLDSLSLHREYGLLRVRSSSASAASTGSKVLVHSVPRVRKRRLKKMEARLGTGDDTSARGTTPLSEQHPSPPAIAA